LLSHTNVPVLTVQRGGLQVDMAPLSKIAGVTNGPLPTVGKASDSDSAVGEPNPCLTSLTGRMEVDLPAWQSTLRGTGWPEVSDEGRLVQIHIKMEVRCRQHAQTQVGF
jgi:hypothetical protein